MTMFVPKGNQSPEIDTPKKGAAEAKETIPATVVKPSLNPFPGWKRRDDEFIADL